MRWRKSCLFLQRPAPELKRCGAGSCTRHRRDALRRETRKFPFGEPYPTPASARLTEELRRTLKPSGTHEVACGQYPKQCCIDGSQRGGIECGEVLLTGPRASRQRCGIQTQIRCDTTLLHLGQRHGNLGDEAHAQCTLLPDFVLESA